MDYNTTHCPLTMNTTRVCGENVEDIEIEISRMGFTHMKPNAVILVNKKEVFDGIGAAPLVHFPNNAPILFTDGNRISKKTLCEIRRLKPKGHKGIHVILVGNISDNVKKQLSNQGLCAHHIIGCNHYETACKVAIEKKEFKNILIMSGEDYSEGIMAAYWAAHHGDPILFVKKDKIPRCTLEILKKVHDVNVYIIGSPKTISEDVKQSIECLNNIKRVKRICGDTPYSTAVKFAMYKDCNTDFGWGRNYRQGHAFTFGTLNHPMEIIAGVVFAHMGKHTPLLLVKKDCVPAIVEKYIEAVKPMPPKDMPRPPFMHGFILGNTENISYGVQVKVDELLSIDHMMGMEGGHSMNDDHDMEHMEHENHMGNMMNGMHHHMMGMEHMNSMNGDHEMEDMEDEDDMHHMMHHHMHEMDHMNGEEHKQHHMMHHHCHEEFSIH